MKNLRKVTESTSHAGGQAIVAEQGPWCSVACVQRAAEGPALTMSVPGVSPLTLPNSDLWCFSG